LVRTGSVDGSTRLGWGDPSSDFFATTAAESQAGLERMAGQYDRIWHYRMYDTVNDPSGVHRAWLEQNGALLRDDAIDGRDYGRLQLYLFSDGAPRSLEAGDGVENGSLWLTAEGQEGLLALEGLQVGRVEAGGALYATVTLAPLQPLDVLGTGLSVSLRLFDAAGAQIAAADESPLPPSSDWQPGVPVTLRLALAAPDPLPPGPLALDLILYRQDTAAPLPTTGPAAVEGVRMRLSADVPRSSLSHYGRRRVA
jgi:hypothetical protein